MNEAFLICLDLIEAVAPYPNAPNLLKCFSLNPKLEWSFLVGRNLMKAVGIATWFIFTQRHCLFWHQGQKKNGKIVLDYFAVLTIILPLIWLWLCLTWENRHYLTYMWMQLYTLPKCWKFLPEKWPIFQRWGCDRIPCIAIPYAYVQVHFDFAPTVAKIYWWKPSQFQIEFVKLFWSAYKIFRINEHFLSLVTGEAIALIKIFNKKIFITL